MHELALNFANVFEYIISDCVQKSRILGGFIDRAGLLVIVCARQESSSSMTLTSPLLFPQNARTRTNLCEFL